MRQAMPGGKMREIPIDSGAVGEGGEGAMCVCRGGGEGGIVEIQGPNNHPVSHKQTLLLDHPK